ncbi:MAG: hypothetical protein SVO01_11445 [Thermotogota bacterium]|nr:hypothetical protein [Thermotogota bacterium]
MVLITSDFKERLEPIERNLKYLIELDLSDEEAQQDKLAMSFYCHFIEKNRIQSLNISSLRGWAKSFTYDTIVNEKLTKRRDTEITAAILAYSTLANVKIYDKEKKKEIANAIPKILQNELTKNNLYFDRPNFTSIILYAAQLSGIKIEHEKKIAEVLVNKYQSLESFSNISGLPFLIAYLINTGKNDTAREIITRAKENYETHNLDYDDSIYLTHAIYQYHDKEDDLLQVLDTIKKTVKETPIMISDIINKGDISDITVRDENRKISRLYKAILLDITEGINKHIENLEQRELDIRYSAETTFKGAALSGYAILCSIPAIVFTYLLRTNLINALDFWLLQNINTTKNELIINTAISFIEAYLITFAVAGIYALYQIIMKEKIIKDQRIKERFWSQQKKVGKWFLISFVGFFILAVIGQLVSGSFQNFIKGPGGSP